MRKVGSLKAVFVILLALSFFVSLALACVDDDSAPDLSCSLSYISSYGYKDLFNEALASKFLSYNESHPLSSKQFVLFVFRQEKSPPLSHLS